MNALGNAMRVISLFAGIAGFDLGFERTGHETVAQVEIDKNCRKLLAAKFPHALLREDVTDCDETNLPPCDLICGGFPCQDLSVAGKRAGLAGSRSGLFYELARIISRLRPRFAVLENVPGLFSSNGGRDFAAVLGALAQLGARDVGWAILDTQWRGLAQRRDRVFIVADFRGECAAEILSLSEGLRGNSPPRRETRQDVAGTFSARASAGGGFGTDFEASGGLMPTMRAAVDNGGNGHGARSGCKDEYIVPVTHALSSEGANASEDGTGRGTPIVPVLAPALAARDCKSTREDVAEPAFIIESLGAFKPNQSAKSRSIGFSENLSPTLESAAGGNNKPAVAFTISEHSGGYAWGSENYPTLQTSHSGSNQRFGIRERYGVRRLTPRECERLQGFPDDWTAGFSDSVRYRMLGNAVAPPVAQYLGEKLAKISL